MFFFAIPEVSSVAVGAEPVSPAATAAIEFATSSVSLALILTIKAILSLSGPNSESARTPPPLILMVGSVLKT